MDEQRERDIDRERFELDHQSKSEGEEGMRKKSSRMSIECQYRKKNSIPFGELEVGDVFRIVGGSQLYIMIQMTPGTLVLNQGVHLRSGERRVFNVHTACVQVKMVCSWVDVQP